MILPVSDLFYRFFLPGQQHERKNMAESIQIVNTRLEHGSGVYDTVRLGYGMTLDQECGDCINADDIRVQLQRFPEGQFVALDGDLVVGMACTMRTADDPEGKPHSWDDAIGDKALRNHVPDGEWLYGVEFTVRPEYRKQRIGSRLYEARFDLVRRLNLRGFYAGGMLMGYHRYADSMTVQQYGEKVKNREIIDPTVTMQMNRGFEAVQVIENYTTVPDAGDAAMLIVWRNPDYIAG